MDEWELRRYTRASLKAPRISAEEERNLVTEARQGDESCRERLLLSNAPVVLSIARGYSDSGLPMTVLVEAGRSGLEEALDRFDRAKEFRSSSWATWFIRQKITRAIADRGR